MTHRISITIAVLLVVGFFNLASQAGTPYPSASGTTWSYTGIEKIKAKGVKETAYCSEWVRLNEDSTISGSIINNGDSTWSQPTNSKGQLGSKLLMNISYADIENIVTSYSEDLGHDIILEWISSFSLKASVNKKYVAKGKMSAKVYISIPDYDLYDIKATVTGSYAGFLVESSPALSALGSAPASGMTAAPEPATLVVLVLGGWAAMTRRRR